MHRFFVKHRPVLDEKDAIKIIVHKAKSVKKAYEHKQPYEECLKELSDMIDDFFEAKEVS